MRVNTVRLLSWQIDVELIEDRSANGTRRGRHRSQHVGATHHNRSQHAILAATQHTERPAGLRRSGRLRRAAAPSRRENRPQTLPAPIRLTRLDCKEFHAIRGPRSTGVEA